MICYHGPTKEPRDADTCHTCAELAALRKERDHLDTAFQAALFRERNQLNRALNALEEVERLKLQLSEAAEKHRMEIKAAKMCIAGAEKERDDTLRLNGELQNSHNALYEKAEKQAAQIKLLQRLCKRIIGDRACICNRPDHRCGTNNMLDDLAGILQCPKCQGTGAYLEANGDDPMPQKCDCTEKRKYEHPEGCGCEGCLDV